MFVRLPAAVPSAGFTVLFGSMGFSMDCLFFEFPLNFPLRFPLPSRSPFTGLTGFPLLRSSWNFQGCIAVHLPRFSFDALSIYVTIPAIPPFDLIETSYLISCK